MPWTILPEPTSTWYVEDGTGLSVHWYVGGGTTYAISDWYVDSVLPATGDAWRTWLNPGVPSIRTFLHFTGVPEDLMVDAEDVTLAPEFVQADTIQWYILPEPN